MIADPRAEMPEGALEDAAELSASPQPPGPYRFVTPYDRYVRVMRIALPALAVLVAGLSFLWPLFASEETSFLLNKDGMPGAGRAVRTVGAVFRGTDNAGRQFSVAAEEALQQEPDAPLVALSALDADIALSDGRTASFHADDGVYDTRTDSLAVPGAVRIETSDGYRLEGADARIDLKARTLESAAPVTGSGPLGMLRAEGVRIDLDSGKAEFSGRVRMRTVPKRKD